MYHACLVTILYFPEASNCFHIFLLRKEKVCIVLPNISFEPQLYTSNFLSPIPQTYFSFTVFTVHVLINGKSVVPVIHAKYFTVNLNASLFMSYTSNPAKPPVSSTFKSHLKSDYLLSFPLLKSYSK